MCFCICNLLGSTYSPASAVQYAEMAPKNRSTTNTHVQSPFAPFLWQQSICSQDQHMTVHSPQIKFRLGLCGDELGSRGTKRDLSGMICRKRSTPARCGAAAAGDVAVISCRGRLFGTSVYHERFRVELHSSARLSGRLFEDDLSERWFRARCSPPSRAAVGDGEGGGKWMRDEKEKNGLWCIIAVLDEDTEGWARE